MYANYKISNLTMNNTTKYEVRNFITKLKQQYKCNVSIFTEIS